MKKWMRLFLTKIQFTIFGKMVGIRGDMRKIFLIIFPLFLLSCSKSPDFYNFRENLRKENIKKYPYYELYKNIESKKEILTSWTPIKGLSKSKNLKVWGASVDFPILNHYNSNFMENFKLNIGEKNINFYSQEIFLKDPVEYSWTFLKNEKEIIPDSESKVIEIEEFLPEDEFLLRIEKEEKKNGDIIVSFNGKEKIKLISNNLLRNSIRLNSEFGLNKIKIITEEAGCIKKIKISSSKNLLLLCLPSRINPENVYFYYLTLNGGYFSNSSFIKAKNLLIEEGNEWVDDFNGENPYGIKRKIHFFDQTWDCIFSPPKTELEFPVKINKNSVLEFGYFVNPWGEKSNIRLSIYFLTGDFSFKVFSREISPESEPDFKFEKIEVGKILKGEGKLIFSTDSKSEESSFVAWINPHLYRKKTPEKTKNVILISLDSLRRDYIGVYNGKKDFTPNIDKLADDSVVFENAYSQAPWTIPSHLSILSGSNPNSHGANSFSDKVPSFAKTLPQLLREKGFLTFAYTGGGLLSANFGFSKGFNQYKEWDGSELPDSSKPIFERADKFILSNKGKDFFLFLHTYQFHEPIDSPEEIKKIVLKGSKTLWEGVSISKLIGGGKGTYKPLKEEEIESIKILLKAEIRTIDEHLIKPLIDKLKIEGIYDQTMIIITSDHGDEIYDHGGWQHSHTLYNELIRVPLIIKFPYQKFKGKRVSKNVRLIDIAPTVLDVLGFDSSEFKMDGKTLISVMKGKEKEERKCFSEIYYDPEKPHILQRISLVYGNYKLIVNQIIPEWKKFFDYPPPPQYPFELYNLRNDPHEKNNLYREDSKIAKEMLEMIKEYKKKTPPKVEKGIIDEELKSKLKALGYIE